MGLSELKGRMMAGAAPSTDAVMVLLVDDQVMVAEAVRRALAHEPNVDFHYCTDPSEALATAKELRPTVILQDLVMPGVDGLDLVRSYREDPITGGIPIIVLSTKEEASIKSDAFRSGANDYLVKLPDKIELVARLRYHTLAYLSQLQRDEAYRALRESQQKLMAANLELQRLNNVDGLTGLSNRRYFNEHMDAEWKRALRTQTPISLLMIDVDNFKHYNDTYGHLAGDEILRQIAAAVKADCTRSTDVAARFGGEEFALVLPGTDIAGMRHLGTKVCETVAALRLPHTASEVAPHITISVGGASLVPERGEFFSVLIDAADKALYEAKRTGKNRVVIHNALKTVS